MPKARAKVYGFSFTLRPGNSPVRPINKLLLLNYLFLNEMARGLLYIGQATGLKTLAMIEQSIFPKLPRVAGELLTDHVPERTVYLQGASP